MTRNFVFVQIQDQVTGRWTNWRKAETMEQAEQTRATLKEKYPKAIWRIRDNNLVTHTY